ncbi:MAG: NADAR family protein [Bradyrhizobium sp.]|jgi:ribA/ribD-fused uncharacterized protein|nr:NADAR family protein [Bradyrhizobium sp.]
MKKTSDKDARSKLDATHGVKSPAGGEISFYRSNERPYGAFSNLYRCSIDFEGRVYPTAEHAYQAGKARKDEVREWILSAPTPSLAAMAAHGLYTWDVIPNWATIKFERMRGVLHAKFTQHDDLRRLLLSTGATRLVEVGTTNNAVNRLWGEVDGNGSNMLGIMLMELRASLKSIDEANDRRLRGKEKKAKKQEPIRLLESA